MKQIAELTGLSVAHFQATGKSPFSDDVKRNGSGKIVIDNDTAFLGI